MPEYPVNPALEAAVIANAEDDTPRLVYADWLDENGDPDRAAYLRNECALWDKNPADEDFADRLLDRLELRSQTRQRHRQPPLPEEVGFHDTDLNGRDDSGVAYHRGFPYFGKEPHRAGPENDANDACRLRDVLPTLFRTTTIRGLSFTRLTRHLPTVLQSADCRQLSALSLHDYFSAPPDTIAVLADSGAAAGLRWLALNPFRAQLDAKPLAAAKFPQLRRLEAFWWPFESTEGEDVAATDWFGQLHRVNLGLPPASAGILRSLTDLPSLHTFQSYRFPVEGFEPLADAGEFRSLASLFLQATFRGPGAAALARVRMPMLSVLELRGSLRNEDLLKMIGSDLFSQLAVLRLSGNEIGDRGVKALAACPSAATLRCLDLTSNNFGPGGLKVIAKAGVFPRLRSLDLESYTKRKASEIDLEGFLQTLSIPDLRHLNLSGWPLGDRGAKALASNPAFGRLTRLSLGSCQIGPAGMMALAESPHLDGLIYLSLSSNQFKMPDLFLDPVILPRLKECWVSGSYGDSTRERLSAARPNVSWI